MVGLSSMMVPDQAIPLPRTFSGVSVKESGKNSLPDPQRSRSLSALVQHNNTTIETAAEPNLGQLST
jgi:hypothetical protein